jgi:hypothetical protein
MRDVINCKSCARIDEPHLFTPCQIFRDRQRHTVLTFWSNFLEFGAFASRVNWFTGAACARLFIASSTTVAQGHGQLYVLRSLRLAAFTHLLPDFP